MTHGRSRTSVTPSAGSQRPRLHGRGGGHAGARHRREHRPLQRRGRRSAENPPRPGSGSPRALRVGGRPPVPNERTPRIGHATAPGNPGRLGVPLRHLREAARRPGEGAGSPNPISELFAFAPLYEVTAATDDAAEVVHGKSSPAAITPGWVCHSSSAAESRTRTTTRAQTPSSFSATPTGRSASAAVRTSSVSRSSSIRRFSRSSA